MEEKNNIAVYMRCIAPQGNNKGSGCFQIHSKTEILKPQGKLYRFDGVFGPDGQQHEVYETCALPLLDDFLAGKNATVFAYGQTGTGKTYTIAGDSDENINVRSGIVPRVLDDIFKRVDSFADWNLEMTYVEIYNEQLCDLLDSNLTVRSKTQLPSNKIRIVENSKTGRTELIGATTSTFSNLKSALKLYNTANQRRQTAPTKLNSSSSRSHAVLTIILTAKEKDTKNMFVRSKLNIVDLAGSENIGRSGAEKKRAQEAGQINRSLLSLGNVIKAKALHQREGKDSFISYRDSKLTHVLQDSLGGPTKTCMIATISLNSVDEEETRSTLEYACRTRSIRNTSQTELDIMDAQVTLKSLSAKLEACQSELRFQRNRDGGVFIPLEYHERIKKNEKMLIESEERSQKAALKHKKEMSKTMATYYREMEKVHNQTKTIEAQQTYLQGLQTQLEQQRIEFSEYVSNADRSEKELSLAISTLVNDATTRAKDLEVKLESAREDVVKKLTNLIDTERSSYSEATLKVCKDIINDYYKNTAYLCKTQTDSFKDTTMKFIAQQCDNMRNDLQNSISNYMVIKDRLMVKRNTINMLQKREDELLEDVKKIREEKQAHFNEFDDIALSDDIVSFNTAAMESINKFQHQSLHSSFHLQLPNPEEPTQKITDALAEEHRKYVENFATLEKEQIKKGFHELNKIIGGADINNFSQLHNYAISSLEANRNIIQKAVDSLKPSKANDFGVSTINKLFEPLSQDTNTRLRSPRTVQHIVRSPISRASSVSANGVFLPQSEHFTTSPLGSPRRRVPLIPKQLNLNTDSSEIKLQYCDDGSMKSRKRNPTTSLLFNTAKRSRQ